MSINPASFPVCYPDTSALSREQWVNQARALCRVSLLYFTRYMFYQRRHYAWRQNQHHTLICNALQQVYFGETKRLIINLPPRYGKTELAVINFIAWGIGNCPDSEFITVSYSANRAVNSTFTAKSILLMPEYQAIFPKVAISRDVRAKGEWNTLAGGVVYGAASGGQIIGFGAGKDRDGFAGAMIIDDPNKPDDARSDIMRAKINDNFLGTISSRLNRPEETPIILIMQRLHEEDLSGFLINGGSGEEWTELILPALNEQTGAALWPRKHSIERLLKMQSSNPYHFAGQYQQRPAPLEGGIVKIAWWQYYKPDALPVFRRIVQSFDTAFKTKEMNDYSVCTTWGETDTGYYLLDIWQAKVEAPDLKRMAISLYNKWQPQAVLIEDKASGQGLIQELRRDTRMPVIPIPKGKGQDKVELVSLVAPMIESGRVFLPEGHPAIAAFVLSFAQFPNAVHDDDVDSTTQALLWFSQGHVMYKLALSGF